MTKSTVTTERLREIIERRSPSLRWGEAEKVAAELLAVREATSVPAAYRYRYNGKHLASIGCGDMVSSWKYCEEADLVNPDERYESQALFTAPPAPAVPGEYVRDERRRMMLNGKQEPQIGFGSGWNACRAAMLQPVSQGYTFDGLNIRAVAALRVACREQWLKSVEFADKVHWQNMHSIANEIMEAMAAAPTPTK